MTEAEALLGIVKQARETAERVRQLPPEGPLRLEVAGWFDDLADKAQKALDDNPQFDWAALQTLRQLSP